MLGECSTDHHNKDNEREREREREKGGEGARDEPALFQPIGRSVILKGRDNFLRYLSLQSK